MTHPRIRSVVAAVLRILACRPGAREMVSAAEQRTLAAQGITVSYRMPTRRRGFGARLRGQLP